jgi:hypothetical protein
MHTAEEMRMGVRAIQARWRDPQVSRVGNATNDAISMTLFKATTLRGEQTIEISKVALLNVLGKRRGA